ncbi:hypothetical protein J1N35_015187 [Gossypium stocksii]|uniref:Uncharacterized protein n=1 Tax=Gossypium stocksii TaxID=47602 RepID=A0A9D3VXV1_9ROSI|nr:hypothetical protein J1N35_015187 [Gossypium stocksii]
MLLMAVSHNEKRVKFSKQNFKIWQQKMLFYLTMLNLPKFLKDNLPIVKEGEVDDVTAFPTIEAWEHSNFLCQNYNLNGLLDALYEVYSVKKTAKELWTSLDYKYKTKDAGAKKFLVAKFLNFLMVDSKLVMNQVKMRHKSSNCRFLKKVRANKANAVEEIFKEMFDMDLCAVISEVNMVD